MRRLGVLFALALLTVATPAAAQRTAETLGPRPFGRLLGDVFTLRSTVDAPAPFTLDRASLPQPGPVTYSLELRRLDVAEDATPSGTRYRIEAEYQTFYSALETREEIVPAFTVALVDGARREEVRVGQWSFLTSPLRPIATKSGETQFNLRPDVAPVTPSIAAARANAIAAVATLLLLLVALAWRRAWWPFHARPSRPFAAAAREVRRLLAKGEDGRRAALLALHRAFDAAAGKRLLGDDVGAFLAARPAFARHAGSIAAFFDASRKTFFSAGAASTGLPAREIAKLARDLAQAERS